MKFVTRVEYEEFKKPIQFGFNWKDWLNDDAIASSEWIVSGNLANDGETIGDTTTSIFLSGGALGTIHKIENQVVTVAGTQLAATIIIEVMALQRI